MTLSDHNSSTAEGDGCWPTLDTAEEVDRFCDLSVLAQECHWLAEQPPVLDAGDARPVPVWHRRIFDVRNPVLAAAPCPAKG